MKTNHPITDALVKAMKIRTTSKDYYTLCCELEERCEKLQAELGTVQSENERLRDARQSAFKEAAEICERAKVVQKYYPQDRVHNGTCGELSKAILAHAEKEIKES